MAPQKSIGSKPMSFVSSFPIPVSLSYQTGMLTSAADHRQFCMTLKAAASQVLPLNATFAIVFQKVPMMRLQKFQSQKFLFLAC